MAHDGQSVKLFVDAKQVIDQKLEKIFRYPDSGPLTVGYADGFPAQAGVLIDEIRISRIIRPIEKIPDAPFTPDNDTIALWHLDEGGPAEAFGDSSKSSNAIVIGEPEKKSAMSENNNRWQQMDHGRFFSATFDQGFPTRNTVPSSIWMIACLVPRARSCAARTWRSDRPPADDDTGSDWLGAIPAV